MMRAIREEHGVVLDVDQPPARSEPHDARQSDRRDAQDLAWEGRDGELGGARSEHADEGLSALDGLGRVSAGGAGMDADEYREEQRNQGSTHRCDGVPVTERRASPLGEGRREAYGRACPASTPGIGDM